MLLSKSHKQNLPSIRVLEKLGFTKGRENKEQIVTYRKEATA